MRAETRPRELADLFMSFLCSLKRISMTFFLGCHHALKKGKAPFFNIADQIGLPDIYGLACPLLVVLRPLDEQTAWKRGAWGMWRPWCPGCPHLALLPGTLCIPRWSMPFCLDVYRDSEARVKQSVLSHDSVSETRTQTLLVKPCPPETLSFTCFWARNLTQSELSHSLSVSGDSDFIPFKQEWLQTPSLCHFSVPVCPSLSPTQMHSPHLTGRELREHGPLLSLVA